MSKTRFESFSDGVYSLAVTLLILGIAAYYLIPRGLDADQRA